MFGLFTVLYGVVMILNATSILNDHRFLSQLKLPLASEHRQRLSPSRQRIAETISATRMVFEVPLIVINICYILYEVFLG